ncbi:transporter [Flavobacterium litorale]|uniref:Transporter n=1 Tax=Flavobacterium litorale TaxID=2856519 RepID=A0ABX8V6L1_9FLAO|nr:transporter [Flavobacterium litorale]QYJ68467.1 transporter [Flavobacterium litorale]
MKKYIVLFVALVAQQMFSHTPPPNFRGYLDRFDDCDACGCSASGGGMGFSSMLNQNFVGVRYFYQSYTSQDGIFNDSPYIDENFNTVQLWARIPVFKNFQISALVPYHSHNRALTTGYQAIDGLGDITVLGLYTIYQTQKDSARYSHTLQAGGGVKMPTGEYHTANNGSVNPSFQVGTGSWDYLLAAEYVVKHNKLGLNAMVNYSIKTENDDEYQFGNQFNYASTLFYVIEQPKYTLVPQLGLAGESYAANKQFGEELPDTEGDILFGKAGIEAGYKGFSAGINAMLPINQNLVGGRVEANYRWSINLNYSL